MNEKNKKHLNCVLDNFKEDINLHLDSDILTEILVKRVDNFNSRNEQISFEKLSLLSTKENSNIVKFIYYKSILSNYEYKEFFPFAETSKFVAAFNISKYFSINMNFPEADNLDYPTMLGYFSLIKISNTWRAIEGYLNLIDKYDNDLGLEKKLSKELRSKLINNIDKNNTLKEICFDLNLEKNSKGESFFAYLDKAKQKYKKNGHNEKKRYECLEDRKKYKELSLFYLIRDIRNSFIHSTISASSGSGNPNVSAVICLALSEHVMECLSEEATNLFLKIIKEIETKV